MISYVEANVKITKDSVAAGMEHARRRAIMEDLLQMLLQNTQRGKRPWSMILLSRTAGGTTS